MSIPDAVRECVRDDAWPRAFARGLRGAVRVLPEDFVVDELPPPLREDARGEHVLLRIRKRNLTTPWLAGGVARHFGVATQRVAYAGLKDRRAVTTQYFGLRWPGALPLTPWYEPGTQVLSVLRVAAPLQQGDLVGNAFVLRIRDLDDVAGAEAWLAALRERPLLPNYFGPQRFGHAGDNVDAVLAWAHGTRTPATRFERGLWLSTARALLFNLALAERVRAGDWHEHVAGDPRVNGVPAGALWGRGRPLPAGDALRRARAASGLADGGAPGAPALRAIATLLEREGVRQGLRTWAMRVDALAWSRVGTSDIELRFTLPAGCYATALLRELLVPSESAAALASGQSEHGN